MDPSIILLPVFAIWGTFIAVFARAATRDGRAPADDIGVMFLLVLALYGTLPPLSWLYQGGTYTSMFAGRLLQLQPSTEESVYSASIALCYALGFSFVYLTFGRRVPRALTPLQIPRIEARILAAAILVVATSTATGLFLVLTGKVGATDTYAEQYRAIAELPLAMRQFLKVLGGLGTVAKSIVLIGLLQRWPRHRGWFFLYVFSIVASYDPSGSRASIATGLLSVLIVWHTTVRSITQWRWAGMFTGGMIAFLVVGFWRDATSWEHVAALDSSDFALGEFDALWANGIELARAREHGSLHVPIAAYFGELFAFIPSQLLPFEKMALSDWYLDTFHPEYKLAGGGWVFGAIAQAVIGGGVWEALLRGAALGGVALGLLRWQRNPAAPWWRFPAYLYILVSCFQSFRSTTFYLLGEVVQTVLPSMFVIGATALLLSRRVTGPYVPAPRR